MQAQWIFSSTFLPYTGEPIEFRLEERQQPIYGTFADGTFYSRWAEYDAERIKSWRGSDGNSSTAPMQVPKAAAKNAFITALIRLRKMLSMDRQDATTIPSRSHARTPTASVIALHPLATATKSNDGNRVSS